MHHASGISAHPTDIQPRIIKTFATVRIVSLPSELPEVEAILQPHPGQYSASSTTSFPHLEQYFIFLLTAQPVDFYHKHITLSKSHHTAMPIYYCTIIIRQTPTNVNGYRQNSPPLIYFYALRHFSRNVCRTRINRTSVLQPCFCQYSVALDVYRIVLTYSCALSYLKTLVQDPATKSKYPFQKINVFYSVLKFVPCFCILLFE